MPPLSGEKNFISNSRDLRKMRQINLLPEQMQKTEQQKIVQNSFVLALIPTVMIICVIHGFLSWDLQNVKKAAEQSTDDNQINEFGDVKGKIGALSAQIENFYKAQKPVLLSMAQQAFSPFLLKNFGDAASNRVWFKKLELDYEAKICRIEGRSYNTRLVSEFMLEVKKMAFFKSVELSSMERSPDGQVDFMIVCNL